MVEDKILSKQEVADLLKVSRRSIDNLRKEGLPFFQMGHVIRFSQVEVMRWFYKRMGQAILEPTEVHSDEV